MDPSESLPECGTSCEVAAHHDGVDEVADHLTKFRSRPARYRTADGDVVLPGIAVQKGLEHGEEQRGQIRPLDRGESLGATREVLGQEDIERSPAEALVARTRLVRGQIESGRRIVQTVPPESLQLRATRSGEHPRLPAGEILVGRRQTRQRRGAPFARSIVEGPQLVEQDGKGREIDRNVVEGGESDRLPLPTVEQAEAHDRTVIEPERSMGLLAEPPFELLRAPGGGARLGDVDLELLVHPSHRASAGSRIGGAQNRMAVGQGLPGGAERNRIEVPCASRQAHVVSRRAGGELLDEPESPLAIGKWNVPDLGHGKSPAMREPSISSTEVQRIAPPGTEEREKVERREKRRRAGRHLSG
jgi:hypothetical protein